MKSLLDRYHRKLETGAFLLDADQHAALEALEELRLAFLSAPAKARKGILKVFQSAPPVMVPQGYYLYGGVGRGKSMVMDLFFESVALTKKRRIHFHAFMLEVHDFLHAQRQLRAGAAQGGTDDVLMACADKIAASTRLLCFDEFQVRDVADAMILGRLFTALFERGVIVVITSNVLPDDLYPDGLQRDLFLPFIALLKKQLRLLPFTGATDYRLNRLQAAALYFYPHHEQAVRELDKIFAVLAEGHAGAPAEVAVKGRVIHIPKAFRDVAAFSFADLCIAPKSATDYLALTAQYRIFIITDIPVLTALDRNYVARFITLIDTLYDHRAKIIISAAAPPCDLYRGTEYAALFQRTVSRLMEMQSTNYLEMQSTDYKTP